MDLNPAYQPIVNLETGSTFGYEALARNAEGVFPTDLFAAARKNGTLAALDWECRAMALQGALDAGLRPPLALFINCEPGTLATHAPSHLVPIFAGTVGQLRHYGEITEHAIAERPEALIRAVQLMRELDIGIAIDDVGSEPQSLALLPVLNPDIIKLDLSVVQGRASADSVALMMAISASCQETGAIVLAEGVENEDHLEMAKALGATLAQGWFFGKPGPLPQGRPITPHNRALEMPVAQFTETPGEVIARNIAMKPASRDFVIELTRHLEQQAQQGGPSTILMSNFQQSELFTPAVRKRYSAFADQMALVCALGVGLELEPAPGVKGGDLAPDDPLADELIVAVMNPHYRAGLVARQIDPAGLRGAAEYEYAVTFKPADVADIVAIMLARVGQPAAVPISIAA